MLHAPQVTAFAGHYEVLEDVAARYGLEPVVYKTYTDGRGDPIILVYRLEPIQRLFQPPAIPHPLASQLGRQISLIGYEIKPDASPAQAGQTINLTLYWRYLEPIMADYKVFVHLVSPDGTIVAQTDGKPQNWGHATTEWLAGEIVPDRIRLTLPERTPSGRYLVYVGMYDKAPARACRLR